MNIFYSNTCPVESAMNLCKVHINKQFQESVQLLSTTLQHLGVVDDNFCKPTHVNHPCAIWTRSSLENYQWLVEHTKALRSLYWNDSHGYDKYFDAILQHTPKLPSNGFSVAPKCINTNEFPSLKQSYIFDDVTVLYKKYLKVKYHNWTTRTDKRKVKVEFINGVPEFMKGDLV